MVKQLEFDALLFLLVGAIAGFFLISYVKTQPIQFRSNAAEFLTQFQPTETPTPTIPFEPTTTSTSQISSDGTHKVVLKTTTNQDLSKTYKIATSDNGPYFYTKTLSADETITLPFNAWEPDNRYFFIQENLASGPKTLVFKADGTAFGNGDPYLDLTDGYAKLGSNFSFDQATGWAADDLIVINTKADDGSQGSSYWFGVPDGSFIHLATKF